ncbi:hypothetical protein CDD83_1846 [Cordyceps sp. RAO-2017]|nr:hypothetical protein CDD83_1846 [Cordyceps sp. RAO-2017]
MKDFRGPRHSPTASRKRQHPSTGEQPADDAAALSSSKKRKIAHPSRHPPKFWDGLSKIYLTKNALRELDRRNIQRQRRWEKNHQPPIKPRRSRRLGASAGGESNQRVGQVLDQYSPTYLRRLKKFATHGGPDLSDLQGFDTSSIPDFDMSSTTSFSSLGRRKRGSRSSEKSSATTNPVTTRNTGPYDAHFEQHLVDHGIYPPWYKYPDGRYPPKPANLADIRRALSQPRPSSSLSDVEFEDFQEINAHAKKEIKVVTDVMPLLEGDVEDRRCLVRQTLFTNLDGLTDGTLVDASPDLCYGARPEQLDRRVRQTLSGQVVVSSQADLLVAPNYFIEVKGPNGSSDVLQRQIIYDMALGERGQVALLAVGEPRPVYDRCAHTLGYTYANGTLTIYAMHMIEPSTARSQPEYVTTLVTAYSIIGSPQYFEEGLRACRNARDWAKRQRDQARAQANERVAAQGIRLGRRIGALPLLSEESAAETEEPASQTTITNHRSNVPSAHDSDTSADELSMDYRPGKRSKGREKAHTATSSK